MTKQFNLIKKLIICGGVHAFLFFGVDSSAANSTNSPNSNASKAYKALDNTLAKQCRFSGTFTQEKSLKGLPIPLKSNGQFLFDCDRGLIWHTSSPIVETKIYTSSSNHYELNDKREIEVLDGVIQTTIANLLLNIMSADTEAIAKDFALTTPDSDQDYDQSSDQSPDHLSHLKSVSLTPNSSFLKKGIESISLRKDPKKNALMITLLDKKAQNTRIHSIETQQNDSKSASLANCQKLFKSDSTCDIFENPSNYEIVSD